jgi:hypothetical protein
MRVKKLAVILMLLSLQFSSLALPQKSDKLHFVKKIYVGERGFYMENQDEAGLKLIRDAIARERQMNSYLEQELVNAGFKVVKDKGQADALLRGTQGITVVVDGPPLNPPKHDYEYHLTPPNVESLVETKDELWKTNVSVRSKLELSEVDRMAALKIVEKLVKAWLKSAKKAGINTGNKIQ